MSVASVSVKSRSFNYTSTSEMSVLQAMKRLLYVCNFTDMLVTRLLAELSRSILLFVFQWSNPVKERLHPASRGRSARPSENHRQMCSDLASTAFVCLAATVHGTSASTANILVGLNLSKGFFRNASLLILTTLWLAHAKIAARLFEAPVCLVRYAVISQAMRPYLKVESLDVGFLRFC